MAQFVFEVDTSPMARTVDSVSNHVKGTAVAVTAMEAAVIAKEQESSRVICENIDQGFYTLIKSQISQKAVAAYTAMTSKLLIMNQFNKTLDSLKSQMMADYQMISRRYLKLFRSLDKSLGTRIKELDKPAMGLADIKGNLVFARYRDGSPTILSAAEETLRIAQTALGAKLKQKTSTAIETLSFSINQTQSYNDSVDSILEDGISSAGEDTVYLPVIFSETAGFISSSEAVETVYTSGNETEYNNSGNNNAIISSVMEGKGTLNWRPVTNEEKQEVTREFSALCEKEAGEERVTLKIRELFDREKWDIPEAGAVNGI